MAGTRILANPPRGRALGRDLVSALMFKTIALALLYLACFGPAHHRRVTPAEIAALIGQPAQPCGKY